MIREFIITYIKKKLEKHQSLVIYDPELRYAELLARGMREAAAGQGRAAIESRGWRQARQA